MLYNAAVVREEYGCAEKRTECLDDAARHSARSGFSLVLYKYAGGSNAINPPPKADKAAVSTNFLGVEP